jgi:hypothetical protein
MVRASVSVAAALMISSSRLVRVKVALRAGRMAAEETFHP